jgi:CheY-like chemotaxis protein
MPLKLFVADDSITIQKIISLAFSGEDALIEFVSNGDAAIDGIRNFGPDIILADVFMPGCNGYEVCAQIKKDPELLKTPVVLLVGTFEPFDEAEASRVQCDGVLMKPFDTSELIRKVLELTGKSLETLSQSTMHPSDLAESRPKIRGSVRPAVMESFLGENRILDILDRSNAQHLPKANSANIEISDECIDIIVERVIKKLKSAAAVATK